MAYSAIALTQLLQPELAVRIMRSSWIFPRYRLSGLTLSHQKGNDGNAIFRREASVKLPRTRLVRWSKRLQSQVAPKHCLALGESKLANDQTPTFPPFFHQWKFSGKSGGISTFRHPYRGGSGEILPPPPRTKNHCTATHHKPPAIAVRDARDCNFSVGHNQCLAPARQ